MRILLADDHDLVRETIASFLMSQSGFDDNTRDPVEVETAGTVSEALRQIKLNGSFDLILLDYDMPGMNGFAGLQQVQAVNEDRPVAIISGTITRALALASIQAGAAGFVPKTLTSKALFSAVILMTDGEIFAPASLLKQSENAGKTLLSTREMDVLKRVCQGYSNKDIAGAFCLSEASVKFHVKTICRKLKARNRTQAVSIARDLALI